MSARDDYPNAALLANAMNDVAGECESSRALDEIDRLRAEIVDLQLDRDGLRQALVDFQNGDQPDDYEALLDLVPEDCWGMA